MLEVVEVGDAETDNGVGIARDRESFDEFGEVGKGRVDVVYLCGSFEAQFDERFDRGAEFGVVEYGSVSSYDADPFEAVDPSFRGCWRESYLPPDIAGRTAAILPQEFEDVFVYGVQT